MHLSDAELAELYDRYGHVVYGRCLRILKNEEEAQDALHETFVKVIRKSESFRGQSSPLTWMYRISTNLCLNKIRNRKGRQAKLEEHGPVLVNEEQTAHSGGREVDQERVLALLDEVDEQVRQVVVYTYFDDCTRKEVAELVGISVPTVRKRLRTFFDRARRVLGVEGLAATLVAVLTLWTWSLP